MTEETPFTIPEGALGDGPNGPDPNEPPVGVNVSNPTPENHTLDHTPENTSENAGDRSCNLWFKTLNKSMQCIQHFLQTEKKSIPHR